MTKYNLEFRDELLDDIATGLRDVTHQRQHVPLACIEVTFCTDQEIVSMSLEQAIRYIACDITWNEEANWRHATSARVRVI